MASSLHDDEPRPGDLVFFDERPDEDRPYPTGLANQPESFRGFQLVLGYVSRGIEPDVLPESIIGGGHTAVLQQRGCDVWSAHGSSICDLENGIHLDVHAHVPQALHHTDPAVEPRITEYVQVFP